MLSLRWLGTAALFGLLAADPLVGAMGQSPPIGTQTVDVMNKLWGRHPGIRANHAKGVVAEGTFVPTPEAAKLSKAAIFAGAAVPVVVRFSDSTGLPTLPDGSPDANPHGMAMHFTPAQAEPVDVVTNSLPFFPVANGEEFLDLLRAAAASGPDAPKPTAFEKFLSDHPAAPKAFSGLRTPTSFARERYNGVDAFIFVDAQGHRQPFRFRFIPDAGTDYLSAEDAAKQAPDFLISELPHHLAQGPVRFRVMAQLANPGDQTRDPTQPWPEDRRLADLGTITLTGTPADQAKASSQLRLLPNRLEPGIEVSDDPLITARVQAYVISFGRRVQ